MCKTVTLQTAVLLQIQDFAKTNKPFSVHDITRTVRQQTSAGELEIPEVEVAGASFRFDIPHSKIKSIFDELWQNGVFNKDFTLNRQFTGMFYEYTPIPAATNTPPITPSSVVSSVPQNSASIMSTAGMNKTDALLRIEKYLGNCGSRGICPTIKQVQSAIKPRNNSLGFTCDEIKEMIEKDLGYSMVDDVDDGNEPYSSKCQVEL